MANKKDFLQKAFNETEEVSVIKKGEAISFSNDETQAHNRTNAKVKPEKKYTMTKRGYTLRDDLVHKYKVIAVQRNKKLYQLMNDALEKYLIELEEQKT